MGGAVLAARALACLRHVAAGIVEQPTAEDGAVMPYARVGEAALKRASELAPQIADRIRPVCPDMQERALLELATSMALIELKYEQGDGAVAHSGLPGPFG
jgi:hypothetical protein